MWKEELKGKIILISDNSTGSSDAGPVPTDTELPLSGVHANTVHTILTESFLKELSGIETLFVELILLLGIMLLSFRYSSFPFTLGALGVAGGYICIAGLFFFYANVIFPIVRPLLMMGFALISIQIASAVENVRTLAKTERAKEVAERDLDIGRQIQSGFLPNTLPSPSGWEIVSHFKAARQVAGDFYDFFKLGNRECIGIVIADVCDKGVGAALFMALIRSLIRAFAMQNFGPRHNFRETSPNRSAAPLLDTIKQTNNYIAETHSESGMFATLFFGVLDPESGVLNYINCGHEPPIAIGQGKIKEMLKPTGPAVGLMPNPEYKVQEVSLHPGDILFAFTDGVTDAQNEAGEFFTKARLLAILASHFDSAEALMDRIKIDLYDHISAAGQFDDVTMIAMRRKNGY
jgi:serine phosphatase RsbU (regulator of sigma subunit)